MRKKYILYFSLIMMIASCKYGDKFKTYDYAGEWSVEYPPYFKKTNYVYPGSELQLMNGYRDTYVFLREILTELPKDSLIDSLSMELMGNLVDGRILSDSTYEQGGGIFQARELSGILNNKKMYYLLAVIYTEDRKYHFAGWMFNDKRPLWEEDYKKILNSWKLN